MNRGSDKWCIGMLVEFRHGGKGGHPRDPWRTGLIIEHDSHVEMASILAEGGMWHVYDDFIRSVPLAKEIDR